MPSGQEGADQRVERETGFEPATPSLEGWRSTAELFPHAFLAPSPSRRPRPRTRRGVVGRGGFEPPKAFASRFTVCPLWPLGYLPACSPDRNTVVFWLIFFVGLVELAGCTGHGTGAGGRI